MLRIPDGGPDVYKIALVGEPFSPITTATFQVHVLLSEEPKGGLVADLIEVAEATVDSVVKLASPEPGAPVFPIAAVDRNDDDDESDPGEALVAVADAVTWRDGKIYLYLVTLNAAGTGEKTVTVKIKDFAGMERPNPDENNVVGDQEMYIRRAEDGLVEGRDLLTVKTNVAAPVVNLTGGTGFFIDHTEGTTIPAGGYLVLTKNKDGSGVLWSHQVDAENKATVQTPAQFLFNVRNAGLPNLDSFFTNGGTVFLATSDTVTAGSVVISEIMWGSDSAQAASANSQWIELHNTTAAAITVAEKKWALFFFNANEALPAAAGTFNIGADAAGTAVDSVGTRDEASGTFWSLAGKGQGGRSDVNPAVAAAATDPAPIIGDTVPIISMQRASTAGVYASGTAASSWSQSVIPALNFKTGIEGSRVGTPGAAPVTLTAPPVVEAPAAAASVAMPEDIMITEIMVDTGGGRLPQWIELTNVSGAEVSLAGWSLGITNSGADDDVIGESVSINLSGTLGVGGGEDRGGTLGKSLLLVAGNARSSTNLAGSDRVVDVSSQLDQKGRYTLISTMAFEAALIPPQTTGILTYGDTAGNLEDGWELPTSEGGRSSLIPS